MRTQKKTKRDADNPAWTKEMFARAGPAREVEPDLVATPPRIGRPPLEKPKQQISLRLDPEQSRLLKAIKARDGIPESEQIRRGLMLWFEQKGVLKGKRKT